MNSPRIPLVAIDSYPEGPLADAIEAALQAKLPAIAGMDEAHSAEERLACYQREIACQRSSFVELYGDAFGWEKRSAPREGTVAHILSLSKVVSLAD
jgi:hypothetical protein